MNTFLHFSVYQEDKININQRRQVISASQDIIPKYSHIVNKSKDSKKRRMEPRVQGYDKESMKNIFTRSNVSAFKTYYSKIFNSQHFKSQRGW